MKRIMVAGAVACYAVALLLVMAVVGFFNDWQNIGQRFMYSRTFRPGLGMLAALVFSGGLYLHGKAHLTTVDGKNDPGQEPPNQPD